MKKIIETLRLKQLYSYLKQWARKNKDRDDDLFDHPYAIF